MIETDLTPLMRQYREIKHAYRDAILFFRVGDFYEMFYEDAEAAARILSIALTTRDKSRSDPVPLCGVPYHAATGYIAKLLQAGRTVALCEQVEDPKLAKGLVRREVVRLYTPGTLTDSELLDANEACFLAAVATAAGTTGSVQTPAPWGLAVLDLSTGEFWVLEFRGDRGLAELRDELARVSPKEVLYARELEAHLHGLMQGPRSPRLCAQDIPRFDLERASALLLRQFRVGSLAAFGCEDQTVALVAAGVVLRYLQETQPAARLDHIRRMEVRRPGQHMHLDSVTIRNLELVTAFPAEHEPVGRRPTTLLSVLDRTVTVMGSRLLREWIVRPLVDPGAIRLRLDAVGELLDRYEPRAALRTALRAVQDIIRLSSRVSIGSATPRDLIALKHSLAAVPGLGTTVRTARAPLFVDLAGTWDDLQDIVHVIDRAILPEAPASTRDGGIIKDGFHHHLDELRAASRDGKGRLAELEAQERARTGIDSLKVRFNQVFGYYIEVTKANLSRVPTEYVRKQTLANAERFTTAELKQLEDLVTGAEQKLNKLEQELFEQVRSEIAQESARIHAMGIALASVDVLAALAEVAARNHYVKPEIVEGGTIHIVDGRHPVVEQLEPDGRFIPNDTLLDLDAYRLLIITGPNMAGKSTYLRQVALIALIAQMGSFVPARRASLGLVDRIFTRVGASDNLVSGQSTFMVEMTETAKILNCATARSLILLDEIGRGTSTYDGLSIAWAVAEHIHDRRHLGARTLFATHYHEMTQLAAHREGIKNYTVAVRERDGEVLFLRKIVAGAADRSYGIYVARLAGLPSEVIGRAQEVLAQLEQPAGGSPESQGLLPFVVPQTASQEPAELSLPSPHPIIEEVRQMDLFSMTPLDALNKLAELQRRLGEASPDPPER